MALCRPIARLRAQADRPVISTLTATAIIQLLGLITGVLLARILGPTGRGELAAAWLWPMLLLTVGILGITDSVTYYAARRIAPLKRLVGTALALAAVQTVPLVAIGVFLIPLVLSQYEPAVVDAGLLFLAVIPFGLVSLYLIFTLNGMRRFAAFNLLRVTVIAVPAAGFGVLAILDELTVTTAILAYLAGQVVTLAGSLALALPSTGLAAPSREIAGGILRYGWRSQISTVSNQLNQRVDQLVLSAFVSPASLGLYVVAWTMTSLTTLIGSSVIFASLPAVAGAASERERREIARWYVALTLLAALATVIPLFALAPVILELAFGESFREAADLARVLLVGSVALATAQVLGAVLKGANRPLDAGIAEAVGLATTAIGLATLLPLLGLMGAAITSAAAYSISCGFALRRANDALGTRGLELLVPRLPRRARTERPS